MRRKKQEGLVSGVDFEKNEIANFIINKVKKNLAP